jgi:serine/threonine protein kinase
MNISLADFGTHCAEHNYYENAFGTRYYQAPEIILIGKCSFPVDIWAIGCTFYELLSGKLLFDPIKDSTFSRDYYHLCLINETCGNFPNDFLKKTKMYKEYKNYFNSNGNIKNYTLPDENRLIKKINLLNLDSSNKQIITNIFINIFKINPSKRWTINDLSKDLFFSD